MAAREASAQGVTVVLAEQKTRVGVPVNCAEFVPGSIREFTVALQGSVVQRIKGIRTFVQGEAAAYTNAPGYILERSIFDKNLAGEAESKGTRLVTNTKLLAKSPQGVIVEQQGKRLEIIPKVIIAGDGPRSLIAGWLNKQGPVLAAAAQYSVELKTELEDVEVYLDRDFPGGYGWLFPKGQVCNLGAAVDLRFGVKVLDSLHNLLGRLLKTGKLCSGKPIRKTGGFIPISGPLPCTQKGNILLVGDAAGFTHPITGGGIQHAIISGQLAGTLAAQAIKADDFSILESYSKAWQECLGHALSRGVKRREYITSEWQALGLKDYNLFARRTWIVFPDYFQDLGWK